VAKLRWRQQEAGGSHDGTGPPERLVDDAHLNRVGHRHDDPLARPDARLLQPRADARGPLEQLARAMPATLEEQRLVIALALERALRDHGKVVLAETHDRWS
jgi:hypothetical protein